MSTNTNLAEALRRLIDASMVAMTDQELATGETLSAWEDANEALAAHDAEQAPACIYPACQHNGCTETCKRRAVPMMPEQASQAVPWQALARMCWDDLNTCYGELGSNWQATEFSEETVSALRSAFAAAPAAPAPAARSDGMPASADERHLRRLLAARVGMPHTYFDDGEAQGEEHGIRIDFMREPVGDIDAKLRALNVARYEVAKAAPAPEAPKNEWRELALKFDGQRMAALSHLRMLLEHGDAHAGAVRRFLAEPPQAQAAGQEPGPGIDTLAAVSAALAQRQPLTDEQITKMIGEYWGRYEFARAIERAHGIDQGKEAGSARSVD